MCRGMVSQDGSWQEAWELPVDRLEYQRLPWLTVVPEALCPATFGLSEMKTTLGHL